MKRIAAVMLIGALAACGGGGSSSGTGVVQANATPVPANPQSGAVSLTLTVPRPGTLSGARHPSYVSTATQSVTIRPQGGPTQTFTIAQSSPACATTPGGTTCTFGASAPVGADTIAIATFASSNGTGTPLSTATITVTVVSGASNPVTANLNGVVASVTTSTPTLDAGTSFSGPITVQAFDAAGAPIVGSAPYANPFTLTDGDASGGTSLTDNATTGLTVTVSGPNDVVILNYDGSAIDPFSISATLPGQAAGAGGSTTVTVINQPVTFPGTPSDAVAPSDPNYHQATLTFSSIPQTLPFTAAQIGWSDHGTHGFAVTLDPVTCGTGAAAVVTIAVAAGTNNRTFNATSQHAGLCKATVTGGPSAHPSTGTIWFKV